MRKRDVKNLSIGDYVRLKHNLGQGVITCVLVDRHKGKGELNPTGRYPMIRFWDKAINIDVWCTYLAVESYHIVHKSSTEQQVDKGVRP